jgi:hypothetical protein
MKIQDLLVLAKNRISYLEQLKVVATQQGDLTQLTGLELELSQTQATIASLETLLAA